jgi:hypothetical protein
MRYLAGLFAHQVVAYASDVTICVSSVTDYADVKDALRLYEKATGACINPPNQEHWRF